MSDIISKDTLYKPTVGFGKTNWIEAPASGDDASWSTIIENLRGEGKLPLSTQTTPLPYISLSQIEMFLRCPKQYEFRYILGKKKPPSSAMIQGSGVHRAVEVGYNHKKDVGNLPPLELSLDSYSDSVKHNITSDLVWDEDVDEKSMRAQGEALIKKWHKDKLPHVQPKAVEKKFVTTLNGIPLVGAIDLVDHIAPTIEAEDENGVIPFNSLEDLLVDNKVVGKKWPQVDADNSLQMSIYSHATGIKAQRYDLFVKTKIPKLEELTTARSAQDIRWAAYVISSAVAEIAAGNFRPCSPGSYFCSAKYCGYWDICRGAI